MLQHRKPPSYFAMALSIALCTLSLRLVAQTATLINTFTNPAPGSDTSFAWKVATFGADRILVGPYLFSTNGALLMSFTNPAPPGVSGYGRAVAAVGETAVVIGAENQTIGTNTVGSAYLFNTNGALLTTFVCPIVTNGMGFGSAAAALGNDRVIIGADAANTITKEQVYLFSTNGTLLATCTNPAPRPPYAAFGATIAASGTERIIIGAPNESLVYQFNTNGILLNMLTNPVTLDSSFGCSLDAVGRDLLLIGAQGANLVTNNTGAAFLVTFNGTLVTMFTNPAPVKNDFFGLATVAVGDDRVIIGAYYKYSQAGTAYLFSTNGSLITEITNPSPHSGDIFGAAMASQGGERVVIASPGSGKAYLFQLPPGRPALSIRFTATNTISIAWPSPSTGYKLQQATNLFSTNWTDVFASFQDNGITKTFSAGQPSGARFYRLLKP